MAEKRKPTQVILLKKQGKRRRSWKIELFPSSLWGINFFANPPTANRYRIRTNGKWFTARKDGRPTCHTRYEIRDLIWKALTHIDFWA